MSWNPLIDSFIVNFLNEDDTDYARSGGHVPRTPIISAGDRQYERRFNIRNLFRQWGIAGNIISTEQPQVTRRTSPVRVRRGRRIQERTEVERQTRGVGNPRIHTLQTARNHPDIQAVDPRSGRRVVVEVDTTRAELERKKRQVTSVNPDARAAFELIDPGTGQPIETHVWNPLTRRFSIHAAGIQRRDVVDFDRYDLDDIDSFSAPFQIRNKYLKSRIFPVTSGMVTVNSSARWDRPSACRLREYTITLKQNVDWWFDENFGTKTFTIPGTTSRTWTGLPVGDYYLEINVSNDSSYCILMGNITVT